MSTNNPLHRSGRSSALGFRYFTCGHSVNGAVRRSTNAAIVALAIPVRDDTDLHGEVDAQRKRLMLR